MIIKKNATAIVDRDYLDNIRLSVCGVGLIAHIKRWIDDGKKTKAILDNIYDMCHHDNSAAIGYIELMEEGVIKNGFSKQELESIMALAEP